MNVLILNGPNLNLLGTRQPDVYGNKTLADVEAELGALAGPLGVTLDCRQSNLEGELITWIQEARDGTSAILINPGAYTHTSVGIRDALLAVKIPAFEVHISNVYQREAFRHTSFIADVVVGRVIGFGADGYRLALEGAVRHLTE